MIKANELRIGNYLYDSNGAVITVTAEMILHIDRTISFNPPTPIPLTPEILEKARFDKTKMNDGYERYFLHGVTIDMPYFEFCYDNGDYNIEIKYVHQLQNLYFSLTGEELTLKFDLTNSTVD